MNPKLKNVLLITGISAGMSILCLFGYSKWLSYNNAGIQYSGKLPVNYAGFFEKNGNAAGPADFTAAAQAATPPIVYIKTKTKAKQVQGQGRGVNPFGDMFGGDIFEDFFGGPRVIPENQASGSGVLISADGYIVTNNHVIDGADEINITLTNKKRYKATLVGADPSSDLAVLKINGDNFPYLIYGNSDEVKIGQWVLAIGYPLGLDVTVSAGIISAKARNININSRQSKTPVESFLQTDAAINKGNSGGALVNPNGELIGITSAIASPTGTYIGYAYAVPVNIVKKAVNDMIKYGSVQRAFLGITYVPEGLSDEGTAQFDKEFGNAWKTNEGVFITGLTEDGGAAQAGIKVKDIITKINNVAVTSSPELVAQISLYKPGDKVEVTYKRDGKLYTTMVTLKNKVGTTTVVSGSNDQALEQLGGSFETLDKKIAATNGIEGGVLVKKIGKGLLAKTRMQEGFVIISINDQTIKNMDELKAFLAKTKSGRIKIEGIYPGYEGVYAYPLNLDSDGD